MKWLIFLAVFVIGMPAGAHEVRPAYLKITEVSAGQYDILWKQPVRSGKRLRLDPVFPDICKNTDHMIDSLTDVAIVSRWRVSCGNHSLVGRTLRIAGLGRSMVDVFVDIKYVDGREMSVIARPNAPEVTMGSEKATALGDYFLLGVRHLLLGFDHILFVVGLVLLIRTPLSLFKAITAFTISHSITLALASLGLVQLSQGAIEAVIALSILFLAVELVKKGQGVPSLMVRYPWAISFIFGLLHGFGFASALMETGLPQEKMALTLLLFNLGVEAGQLIVVVLMLALLLAGRYLPTLPRKLSGYFIGTMAAFWFIDRLVLFFHR